MLDPEAVVHGLDPVTFVYHLPDRDEQAEVPAATLEIADVHGNVIRSYGLDETEEKEEDDASAPGLPVEPGFNRFRWDGRIEDAVEVPGAVMWGGGTRGPRAAPGTYLARMTIDGDVFETAVHVLPDPRIDASTEHYAAQYDLLVRIRDATSEVHRAVNTVRSTRAQIQTAVDRARQTGDATDVISASESINAQLDEIEEALIQRRSKSRQDPLNFPIRLNDKISNLAGVVSRSLGQPTAQSFAVLDDLLAQARPHLEQLDRIVAEEVPRFNELVNEASIPAVIIEEDVR